MNELLYRWSARRLRDGIARRDLSAVEVVESHLRRIDAVNGKVNAIVTLMADQAMEAAKVLDHGGTPVGSLRGVPVAIKDLMDVEGIQTTHGSPIYKNNIARRDSLIVRRLREAGAVIVGKTNVPEFGAGSHTFNEVFGRTRNPYALDRSAGGSSGGAAAALASGLVPLADGSDLGGSLRNPASFCGVVGVRPSPGRVPWPDKGDPWDPHVILGPMARSIDDAALMLSAIGGADSDAPLSVEESAGAFANLQASDLRGVRIAWSRSADGLPVDPAVTEVLEAAREILTELGAVVEDVEPDLSGADFVFETLRSLGILGTYAEDAERWPELVKPEIHEELQWARALTGKDIATALNLRGVIHGRMLRFMESFDLLALPAAQVVPFDVDWRWPNEVAGVKMDRYHTWMRVCSRITTTTLPCLSLPAGFTADDLPIGLQLVGRPRREERLMSQAMSLEHALAVPTLAPLD